MGRGRERREEERKERKMKRKITPNTDSKIQTFVVPLFKGYVSNTKSLCIMCKK